MKTTVTTTTIANKGQYGISVSTNGAAVDTFVAGECEAMILIGPPTATDSKFSLHDAGNKIIELAERIKAQRSVIGMMD